MDHTWEYPTCPCRANWSWYYRGDMNPPDNVSAADVAVPFLQEAMKTLGDTVNRRFDEVDKRFDKMADRFDRVVSDSEFRAEVKRLDGEIAVLKSDQINDKVNARQKVTWAITIAAVVTASFTTGLGWLISWQLTNR
jgi:hypothetical protein